METLICTKAEMPAMLATTAFLDRGKQFVSRLGWDLCVSPSGLERDEYDDENSVYLTVHDQGKHLGSCRVRSSRLSTMITDHFLGEFPGANEFIKMQKGRIYELTRFCRAPDISVAESTVMLQQLAILLDTFRDMHRLTGFVAVVFPQIARFLDTIGVRYLVISKSTMEGKTVLMICITHAERVARQELHKTNPHSELSEGSEKAVAVSERRLESA